MKYQKSAILLSFVLFFCACATTHAKLDPQAQHNRPTGFWENEKAVVQVFHYYYFIPLDEAGLPILAVDGSLIILQERGLGTGGVLDINGLVITNNHVITANSTPGKFIIQSPQFPDTYTVCTVSEGLEDCAAAEVAYRDPTHDLALLYTDHEFTRAIELADYETEPGEELYFWGNVGFIIPPSPFFGHYVGLIGPPYVPQERSDSPLPIMMMDINVSFGSSGSPVFDEQGKCIGLAVSFLDPSLLGSRSLPFIIPVSTIREALSNWVYQR